MGRKRILPTWEQAEVQGLCVSCRKHPRQAGRKSCSACLEEARKRYSGRDGPRTTREKQRTRMECEREGICTQCRIRPRQEERKLCPMCLEKGRIGYHRGSVPDAKAADSARRRQQTYRERALAAYGGKCTCCGETEMTFLCFDHINGGGGQHRKVDPAARNLSKWVCNNDFPDFIQLLCWNCNAATRWGRTCPHQVSNP